MTDKSNLAQKFAGIREYWSPKIAGEVNDTFIKLVKFKGDFVWHHHDHEDELFLVVKGWFIMRLRDGVRTRSASERTTPDPMGTGSASEPATREVRINEGEFIIVPRGVEHMPVAPEEVEVMLIEPRTTLNTGNVVNERTLRELGRV